MAGGDIDVIFTADDKDVTAGLDRLARKAGGFSAELAKATSKAKEELVGFKNLGPAAGAGIAAGFAGAAKAVMDYADKNDLVAGSLNKIKAASAETWTAIGRDISAVVGGELGDFIRTVEKARQGTVDFIAGIFSSDAEGVGEAMKATEAMIKGAKEAQVLRRESMQIEAQLADAAGDSVGAAKIRAELEKEATLERINAMNLTNSAEKAALLRQVERKALADVERAKDAEAARRRAEWEKVKAQDNEGDKKQAEDQKRRADEQKARDAAREKLDLEIAGYEIDALRGEATKDEIARMEKQLELRRKIMDIEENELLSASDKERAIRTIQNLTQIEMAQIKPGQNKTRESLQVEAGLLTTGSALAAAVGAGPAMNIAQQTRDASLRTAKAVEKIAGSGVAAVFS